MLTALRLRLDRSWSPDAPERGWEQRAKPMGVGLAP